MSNVKNTCGTCIKSCGNTHCITKVKETPKVKDKDETNG